MQTHGLERELVTANIGRFDYTLGFLWSVVEKETVEQHITQKAHLYAADHVCSYNGCLGFGKRAQQKLPKSLAVLMSSFLVRKGIDNCLGLYTFSNQWWLYVLRRGLLTPGFSDALFSSEQEAREGIALLVKLYPDLEEAEKVGGCHDQGNGLLNECPFVQGAVCFDFKIWFCGVGQVYLLGKYQSMSQRVSKRVALGVALMVGLGFLGLGICKDLGVFESVGKGEISKVRALYLGHPEKLFVRFKTSKAYRRSQLRLWYSSILKTPTYYLGWKLLDLCCQGEKGGFVKVVRYTHTTMANYQELPKNVVFERDAKKFKMNFPLERVDEEIGLEDFESCHRIETRFLQLAQSYALQSALTFAKKEVRRVE
ncbi:MAG: hypothetical protein IK079_03725, partial [Desulfovibrio sp.]|nr:hypothetical protein [Desulfovibrio sp.]